MDSRKLFETITGISGAGFGCIVLRDIPKQQAQIDTVIFQIKGGFRGFQLVPAGPHYVSVTGYRGERYRFWCYLQADDVIVKVFEPSQSALVDDTPEATDHYTSLASSGAMGTTLLPYNVQALEIWITLTNHISESAFPLTLHPIPDRVPNRFAHAFNDIHGGQAASFLAEFQFAFASWYVNASNQTPLQRWVHLVQAIYNAGEGRMAQNPQLFSSLVDAMISQFNLVKDSEFTGNSLISRGADYLAEDLMDTEIDELVAKGKAFEAYLTSRQP